MVVVDVPVRQAPVGAILLAVLVRSLIFPHQADTYTLKRLWICGRVSPEHGIVVGTKAYPVRPNIVATLVFAIRVQVIVAHPEIGPLLPSKTTLVNES
jgi:hypothetical protein